jgi:hypothetical protein
MQDVPERVEAAVQPLTDRAVGVLAQQEESGSDRTRPYDRVAQLIGCVKGGPRNLSARSGEKFPRLLLDRRRSRR